jgi:hypothetical protein
MNFQENSPNQRAEPDDGVGTDRELKNLLNEWRVPGPTAALGERVFSDYRRQFQHRTWWRRWLAGSIRLPVPVATILGLLLCATSYLALRKAIAHSAVAVPVSAPVKVVEVPVPVVQEKLVTRVVYVKARPQKAKESSAPDTLLPIDENKALPQADLTGFRPVSEIKIIVMKGTENDEK